MSKTQTGTLLHHLRKLVVPGESPDLTDRQLLERFVLGDQAAFTSIIKRHGRLVWDACRRTLGDEHDAEDSFQAVFVVLACKAGSIRRAESLSSWLHGVALRTAMNAKRKTTRRRVHEKRHAQSQAPKADGDINWQQVQTLLDEEIERLPPAYRAVFVLCFMEGKSVADAARELDKTEGAAAVALSRARKLLQERLLKRGVALGSVLAAVALTGTQAAAAIPSGLVNSTIRAAASVTAQQAVTAGVVSESVAALVKTTIKEMTRMSITKLSIVLATVIVTGVLGGGAAWFSVSAHAENPSAGEPPATANATKSSRLAASKQIAERIAWGKTVDGLQAGLEATKDGRTCRLGESVKFVVWVRKTSDKPAKLTYHPEWSYSSRPLVLGSKGKPIKADMPPPPKSENADLPPPGINTGPLFELTLDAGEEAELASPELAFEPADSKGDVEKITVRTAPTVCKVQYEGLSHSHPSLKTGQVEIKVQPSGTARVKEKEPIKGNALKLAGSSWQEQNGDKGPTFHADGTGLNKDGSKFEWRVEGDLLLARRLVVKGKPEGWTKIPILFSRDAKEFRFIAGDLKGISGEKEYRRFRISAETGKLDDKRTEEGKQFRRRWIPQKKENEGDTPSPSSKPAPSAEGVLRISPNVHVSKANAEIFHTEVVLACDPTDARRLVSASMYSPPPVDPSAPKIIVYTSTDGGKSWTPTLKRTDANPVSLADPAFAWGANNSLFFVNMWAPSLDRLVDAGCLQVVRSQDGGQTWGSTTTVKGWHDRPFLAVDNTGGKYHGRLYCQTHQGLLVSTDAGRSFGSPRSWTRRSGYVAYASCNPVVLSDGTLVAVSNNSSERKAAEQKQRDPAQDPRYLSARVSRDGGDSFSEERVIAEYRGDGYVQAAAAPSHTSFRDRLYIVWQETLPSRRSCIRYVYSKDRGKTFSKPVILSEQSEEEGDKDAFLPSIAVNKSGVVAVTWYDTRGLRPGEAGWDVRIRASLDGGETWQPSVQVSDAPTRKDKKNRKRLSGVGHTAGLAADADGVFHLLWVDGRNGVSQVYTAVVTVRSEKQP